MRCHRGVTLVELIVVLTILVALASMIVPMLSRAASDAQADATRASLRELRELLVNRYRLDCGDLPRSPMGGQPQLRYLFIDPLAGTSVAGWDPIAKIGWHGPYLVSGGTYPRPDDPGTTNVPAVARGFDGRFGLPGDATPIDGWGNPIVLQEPDANGDGNLTNDSSSPWARLVSAGPNGVLDTPLDAAHITPAQLAAHPSDDLVVYLFMADTP